MTKKILALSLFIMVGSFMLSCQKQRKADNNQPTVIAQGQKTKKITTTMSPGQIHNYYLSRYFNQNPFTKKAMPFTFQQSKEMTKEFIKLLVEDGVLPDATEIDAYVDEEMINEWNQGFYNSDSTMKTTEEIIKIHIAANSNSSIRIAFENISDYGSSSNRFISFVDQQLDQLQNLSEAEQVEIEGVKSVFTSSHRFWTESQTKGFGFRLQWAANADAIAFDYMWNRGIGLQGEIRLSLAAAYAAKISARVLF